MRWGAFAAEAAELALFGRNRLLTPPAYLATVRRDGRPRVHPVTPVLTDDGLFVFMEPNSPKGSDLRERRSYALHCRVDDVTGGGGEFFVAGEGVEIVDADHPTSRGESRVVCAGRPLHPVCVGRRGTRCSLQGGRKGNPSLAS